MASGRRKAKERREPIFDATPTPGLDLRPDPRDRPGGPPVSEAGEPRTRARRRKSADNDDLPEERSHQTRARKRPARRKRGGGDGRSFFGRLAYWTAVLGLWGTIGAVAAVAVVALRLPPIQSLEVPKRPPSIQILGLNGRVLATRGEMGGAAVALKQLPKHLTNAFIAIEDRRFHSHLGLDPFGIARALLANVMRRGVAQGGSTITQQLAKNLFLTQERTLERKLQEVVLALWLEHKFSKEQILELYLNRVYFGSGAYGVEAAAQRYFGKSARQVTLSEAALLAGLVKSPSRLAPTRNFDGAERRAQVVIAAMIDAGFIGDDAAKAAFAQAPAIVKGSPGGSLDYVGDYVLDVLNDLIGHFEQDIVVTTTIDPLLQAAAEKALVDALAAQGQKLGVGQGALVAMTPQGAVRALVGGRNYGESQFNRAVSARRQPGSAFKPFVYLAALERGLTPDSVRLDAPVEIKGWRPENYTREYFGQVTLTRALALSLNTVSVRLTLEVGPKAVVRTAHRLGIASRLEPNASIALGTSEVSVLELTGAYAPFANGGIAIAPHIVERIRTAEGKELYRARDPGLGRVIDDRHVAMMNTMMQETLLAGTGRKAELPGWQAAGKTGTSQDFRDAWFVGYTGQLVAGVWLGNDDNSSTRKLSGSGLPVEIWSRFMKPAHQGLARTDLPGLSPGIFGGPPVPPATIPPSHGAPMPPGPVAHVPSRAEPNTGGSVALDGWLIDRLFGRR
ncbi:MAG: penicillin-binding protein [Bradyrhizobiaceae bacterium]|nr:MAG: penicillin-binding protein [Bradyrhizobiaceae bacterium]